MSLLTDLQAEALEPEYRTTTGRRRSPVWTVVVIALLAVLITVAAIQTTRGAGTAAQQRGELLERVEAARERQAELGEQATTLDEEIRRLGEQAIEDPAERQQLTALELATGVTPVTGPGIVVTVGDSPEATSAQGLVLDSDLSKLVNGLRAAGAEAIAINGRRLTALTPIRAAGAAITVDYVSLSPPYRVEVVGDPNTLQSRFNQTPGAAWWQFIASNYGLTMSIVQSDGDLNLPADPGMSLRYAKRK